MHTSQYHEWPLYSLFKGRNFDRKLLKRYMITFPAVNLFSNNAFYTFIYFFAKVEKRQMRF